MCCAALLLCPVRNSSGGVVNVKTESGKQPTTVEASSYPRQLWHPHYGMKASGAVGDGTQAGDVDYTSQDQSFHHQRLS